MWMIAMEAVRRELNLRILKRRCTHNLDVGYMRKKVVFCFFFFEVAHSCLPLCDPTDCSLAHQAPLSVGFSRQEYWSGLPFPSPGDLPNPGSEPGSPALQADTLPSEPPGKL